MLQQQPLQVQELLRLLKRLDIRRVGEDCGLN